jgi:drug/metabolite transporter (DMT)-like permease
MKLADLFLVIVSNLFFVANQVAVKLWLDNKSVEIWPITGDFFRKLFCPEIAISVASFLLGGIIWVSLLKRNDFTVLYPLISISYVFSTLAGYFIFHESFALMKYLGIVVIVIGVIILTIRS